MPTTWIRRRVDMRCCPLDKCHGGKGAIEFVSVLGGGDWRGRGLNFFHDDVLPPGTSIGVHDHKDDEEYYYIVSGSGVMTLDGVEHAVAAGDVTAVFPGGRHGLENRSSAPLRIIVVSVAAPRVPA